VRAGTALTVAGSPSSRAAARGRTDGTPWRLTAARVERHRPGREWRTVLTRAAPGEVGFRRSGRPTSDPPRHADGAGTASPTRGPDDGAVRGRTEPYEVADPSSRFGCLRSAYHRRGSGGRGRAGSGSVTHGASGVTGDSPGALPPRSSAWRVRLRAGRHGDAGSAESRGRSLRTSPTVAGGKQSGPVVTDGSRAARSGWRLRAGRHGDAGSAESRGRSLRTSPTVVGGKQSDPVAADGNRAAPSRPTEAQQPRGDRRKQSGPIGVGGPDAGGRAIGADGRSRTWLSGRLRRRRVRPRRAGGPARRGGRAGRRGSCPPGAWWPRG
jgi:hypothetical protein